MLERADTWKMSLLPNGLTSSSQQQTNGRPACLSVWLPAGGSALATWKLEPSTAGVLRIDAGKRESTCKKGPFESTSAEGLGGSAGIQVERHRDVIAASLKHVSVTAEHTAALLRLSQKSDSHLPDFGMFIPHRSFITQDWRADQHVNVLTRNSVVVTPHGTQRETSVILGWINIVQKNQNKTTQGALFVSTLPHTLSRLHQ